MVIAHLLTDRDPDCLEAMHRAESEMDRIHYRVQSVSTLQSLTSDDI